MERRFGHDFGQVQVHTDAAAQELARLTQAQALTWGPHIIFGAGQYAPMTSQGQHLLAHELVHTIQQASGVALRTPSRMVLQRQPQPGSASEPPITAQTIFPFPLQSQIALNQILNEELFGQLAAVQPRVAATLQALNTRRATVQIATPEHFEAVLNEALALPASGGAGQPAVTYSNVTIRLRRNAAGRFDFSVVGQVGAGGTPVALLPLPNDLTATRQGNRIVLSAGAGATAVPHLGLAPGAGGALNLSFFTAPFLDDVPAWARGMIPEAIEAISLSELPPASAGTTAVEQAASEAAARAQSQRRVRRQELRLGLGGQFGGEARLVLGTAWQYTFTPSETAGSLFQVPLRVQLQYAPPDAVLAAIASGAGTSLPLKVPVNLRVLAGIAAGAVPGPEGASSPRLPAVGLTLGAGGGVELGSWRINLDYEHLFNFVEASPNVDTFLLSVGRIF
jgi:hypothetical protein